MHLCVCFNKQHVRAAAWDSSTWTHSAGHLCGGFARLRALFAVRTNARERAWHRANEKLAKMVQQDALMGLGNRILLQESLTERLSRTSTESTTALLFADLDGFESINDTLGHAFGDRLLIEVGKRLVAASPIGSTVCRLGGDEFVVLTTASSTARAETIGTALLDALQLTFSLGDHVVHCAASIGIVMAAEGKGAPTNYCVTRTTRCIGLSGTEKTVYSFVMRHCS